MVEQLSSHGIPLSTHQELSGDEADVLSNSEGTTFCILWWPPAAQIEGNYREGGSFYSFGQIPTEVLAGDDVIFEHNPPLSTGIGQPLPCL
jgi:hypothetical protein